MTHFKKNKSQYKCELLKQEYNKNIDNYMNTKQNPNDTLQTANTLMRQLNAFDQPAKALATKFEQLKLIGIQDQKRSHNVKYLRTITNIILSSRHTLIVKMLNDAIKVQNSSKIPNLHTPRIHTHSLPYTPQSVLSHIVPSRSPYQ